MITLAGIDVSKVKNTVFFTQDADRMLTIKPIKHTKMQGDHELTVLYKVGNKLKAIQQILCKRRGYAAEECLDHILSGEEVADRDDPNRGSDAFMYAQPELDEEQVVPMEIDARRDRFAWFVAVAHKVAQSDVLEYILENAPKQKVGAFAKKTVVIAALPIVFDAQLSYFEIVGKAKADNLLEITIQERKFSETEWEASNGSEYLYYLAGGPGAEVARPIPKRIKISHVQCGERTTIDIPVVQLETGELAIDSEPYYPISAFSCVKGNDQKGYEILEPVNPIFDTACHNGITSNIIWELQKSASGISSIWLDLNQMAKYIRTKKKAYFMRAQIFTGAHLKDEDIPERCMSEKYIAEVAGQLLWAMEGINKYLEKPNLKEEITALITRSEDGKLIQYAGKDIPIQSAPGRELPLVFGQIILRNQNEDDLKIWYRLSRRVGDDWSEYSLQQ